MINNYYNIPSIPCSTRLSITPSTNQKDEKCQGLNPDMVYQTLYPTAGDPLSNFTAQANHGVSDNEVSRIMSADAKNCAIQCSKDNACKYLEVSRPDNICRLYSDKDTSQQNLDFSSYNVQTFRKNDLLEGNMSCDPADNFIEQPSNHFPRDMKLIKELKDNLSKNECLSSCQYDDNCNSVIFGEGNSICKIVNNATPNILPKPGINLYKKNDTMLQNRFNAPDDLTEYYQQYNKDGKEGDFFCQYVESTDSCETSYVVGKMGERQVPKKKKPDPTFVPPPKICMPPHCIPCAPEDGQIGKLKINNSINIKCAAGDLDCQNKIAQVSYYDTDLMGLPSANGSPNPSNGSLPYTSEYSKYENLSIQTAQMGQKPEVNGFEFPEQCEKWCKESQDCGGISYTYGTDGKVQCKYYDNVGVQNIRNSLKESENTTSMIKRGTFIETDPLQSNLNKPYFNDFSAKQTNTKKVKTCINMSNGKVVEPFVVADTPMQEDIPRQEPDYGYCPNRKTKKKDSWGSNCPSLINKAQVFYPKCPTETHAPICPIGTTTCGRSGYCYDPSANRMVSTYLVKELDYCPDENTGKTNGQMPIKINGVNVWFRKQGKDSCSYEIPMNFPNYNSWDKDLMGDYPNVNNCQQSLYGCCPDNKTAKNNAEGSNCLDYSKEDCIKSEHGCCPGTNVPKKYICQCGTDSDPAFNVYNNKIINDSAPSPYEFIGGWYVGSFEEAVKRFKSDPKSEGILKIVWNWGGKKNNLFLTFKRKDNNTTNISTLRDYQDAVVYMKKDKNQITDCDTEFCRNNQYATNCELNNNQVGDPYETGTPGKKSCMTNVECGEGNQCKNGFCAKINPKYYNSLNNLRDIVPNPLSGTQFNNIICGNRPNTHTPINNECPSSYDPVCGTDGKTYKNDCSAVNSGVDVQYTGACDRMIEGFISKEGIPKPKQVTNYISMLLFGLLFLILILFICKNWFKKM